MHMCMNVRAGIRGCGCVRTRVFVCIHVSTNNPVTAPFPIMVKVCIESLLGLITNIISTELCFGAFLCDFK